MSKPGVLAIILLVCIVSTSAQMKDVYIPGMPPPPPPLDPEHRNKTSDETTLKRRVDPAQLQRDAEDLARTAQTIPSDVGKIRQGTLPRDTIQKLKEIEKLSKRLRSELNP